MALFSRRLELATYVIPSYLCDSSASVHITLILLTTFLLLLDFFVTNLFVAMDFGNGLAIRANQI